MPSMLNRQRFAAGAAIYGVLCLLTPTRTFAVTVTPGSYAADIGASVQGPGFVEQTSFGTVTQSKAGVATATASAGIQGSPYVSASSQYLGDINRPFNDLYAAVASLSYQFVISGPAGVSVPILFNAAVGGSQTFGAYDAYLKIGYAGSGTLFSQEACSGQGSGIGGSCAEPDPNRTITITNQAINLTSNRVVLVDLYAQALTEQSVGSQSNAFVDPYFQIDPSFNRAPEFALLFSPGITQSLTAAVPEPSTWAMMIIGLAGLGFAAYRRRLSQGSATA